MSLRFRTRSAMAVGLAGSLLIVGCGPGKQGATGSNSSSGGVSSSNLPKCPVDDFKKASKPVDVVFWHSWVGNTAAALQQIVDRYNASQSKVRVRAEVQGADYKELRKNYEAGAAAKQLPAIVGGEDTWTQFMVDSGTAIPAQSCINADTDPRAKVDDLVPGVKAAYTVNKVQWPAAFGVSTVVLYINRDHFKAAGLDPDKPPTTLEELRTASEALKKISGKPNGPSGEPLAMKLDPWFIENMVSGANQVVVNHANGRDGKRADASQFKTKQFTDALDWLASMKQDGLLNAIPSTSLIDHYVAVATQKSSMLLETSTAAALIDQVTSSANGLDLTKVLDAKTAAQYQGFNGLKVAFKVGVAASPGLEAAGRGQVGGSGIYLTSGGSPEVTSAAWDFLKYFNQVDNQVIWTRDGSYLPARESTEKALNADPAWGASQRGQWITTAFAGVKTIDPNSPGPLIGPFDKFNDSLGTMLEAIALGDSAKAGAAVGPAVSAATVSVDAALKKYNATNA